MDIAVKRTKAWEYSERVLDGDILTCNWIKLAVNRFRKDLKRSDLIYDLDEVEQFTEFWEKVVYVPELRAPSPLPLPYAFAFQQLYGFKYKDSELRRFTDLMIEVARKNIKTFSSAAISGYELLLGHDPFPEILHGANSRDQALICTDKTGKVIKASPEIYEMVESDDIQLFTYKKKITEIVYDTLHRSGRIEAMPRDPGDGGNPSASVIDEFHEATDTKLIETIRSGQGARREPINIIISSPGFNKEGPLYSVYRDEAVKMLQGQIESDRALALIFEQDNEEDWDNLEMIEKANPMLPYITTLKPYVENRILEAKRKGGATEVSVKIKNCGIWTDSAATWIADEVIRGNNFETDLSILEGQECYLGIDLSKSKDLTVVLFYFPYLPNGKHGVYVQCHIPEQKIEDNEDHVDYQKWVDEGWIISHPGNVLDPDIIADMAMEKMEQYSVSGVGFDAKYAYQGAVTKIAKNGYEEECLSVGQGFGLSSAVSDLENLIESKKMEFFGNPVTRWNFGNVIMAMGHQGHQYPSKKESRNKIDIVSALCTARFTYSHFNSEEEQESGIDSWD
ncbi:MAG: terminase large subunit [bacterium]|nr:terminase large subunit [bacterium]